MEQGHKGKTEQVGRQGLLHLHGRRTQRLRNAAKGRQVGIDGKRAQHTQQGQQNCKRPLRGLPEGVCFGVHAPIGTCREQLHRPVKDALR